VIPEWVDAARPLLAVLLVLLPLYAVALLAYATSPATLNVGYMPAQPLEYSHAMHAGELGLDCRYCHMGVERGAWATLPSTASCMNCHGLIKAKSAKVAPLIDRHNADRPVEWTRVCRLPEYAFFNHSAHVTRGVGCVTCHGRVDRMEQVYQAEPLSMGWCLDCHRRPELNLRPPQFAASMDWRPPTGQDAFEYGRTLRSQRQIQPSTDCTTCHR
jgi:hypothetical protein